MTSPATWTIPTSQLNLLRGAQELLDRVSRQRVEAEPVPLFLYIEPPRPLDEGEAPPAREPEDGERGVAVIDIL